MKDPTLSSLLSPEHLDPTFFWGWTLGLLALMPLVAVVCKRSRTFASQPMVAAYDLTTLIPVVTLSWLGFRMLLGDPSVHEIPTRSSAFVEHTPELIMIQAAYQVFGTVAAVLIGPPLRTTTMIAHHVATGLTAWLSLQGHCMYYAIYFAGVVELTNIPLTFMDLCMCRRPARLPGAPCERSNSTAPSPSPQVLSGARAEVPRREYGSTPQLCARLHRPARARLVACLRAVSARPAGSGA
eukprot:scaffold41463_cov75-Phaeocystis_antarctica.AAC.7